MIDIDFTLWVQAVNFLVIVVILNSLIFKPVLKVADERDKHIRDLELQAKASADKTAKAIAEYEKKLSAMRSDASEVLSAARKEATEEAGRVIAEAQASFDSKLEASRAEIDRQVSDVSATLQKDVSTYAQTLASRIMGRSL